MGLKGTNGPTRAGPDDHWGVAAHAGLTSYDDHCAGGYDHLVMRANALDAKGKPLVWLANNSMSTVVNLRRAATPRRLGYPFSDIRERLDRQLPSELDLGAECRVLAAVSIGGCNTL